MGRPSVVDPKVQAFVADVITRHDRGNDGKTQSESIDLVQQVVPALDRKQAAQVFKRTILPHFSHLLKQNPQKAQATTTKRSAITVQQQFRWFQTYDGALNELRRRNTGVCNLTGKTFGELIHHFIFGGDEACMMASSGGLMIIGSKDRKKHERAIADSRVSMSVYRIGNVAGTQGPTIMIMSGKRRRKGFTDAYLKRYGAAEGSTIVMTPTAFVTEVAWLEMTPFVIKGIRAVDVVKANPQWWALEVFDGFGPHVSSYEAMKLRYEAKILSLKEEGDSSHVNQSYDRFVAKSDKSLKCEGLSLLRSAPHIKMIDQWAIISVVLYILRETKPETWTSSFRACNMDPRVSISFPKWCEKISPFLLAGQKFKSETPIDKYALLPAWWHGTAPTDKKFVMQVIDKHGAFTPDCCMDLKDKCHIAFAEQPSVRVCYELAKESPEQLEMGIPDPQLCLLQKTMQMCGKLLNQLGK
uniref:Uncharacterized protein n=1 Tax=Attheya septentrionalis TaxID=420275 RepID=A0A7S2XM23_9STRA|mmetsp:Transcript_18259/g.33097  ORF Transcript_18259/g.33097 Transcript_18259/m.33097 type:complete len:470 (+) Transcript_18259:744-2153(+)